MRAFTLLLLLATLPLAEAHAADPGPGIAKGISDTVDKMRSQDKTEGTGAAKGGAAISSGISGALFGSGCTRHFYNRSGFTWEVMPNETLRKAGMCALLDQCRITAGLTSEIRFPNWTKKQHPGDDDPGEAKIRIVGHLALQWDGRSGVVFDETYIVTPDDVGCVTLVHRGSTGNVVLNDPAKGDIQTCGQLSYKCDTAIAEPKITGECPTCRVWCADGRAVTPAEFNRGACRNSGGKGGRPPG